MELRFRKVIVSIFYVVIVNAMPMLDQTDVQRYLQTFGYLNPSLKTGNLFTESYITEAIKQFQKFTNLPITGVADEATKELMKAPRCGVPDVMQGAISMFRGPLHKRRKRYVLQGSKWPVKQLTWSVSQPTDQMSHYEIEDQITRAANIWSEKSALRFSKSNGGHTDIDIRFTQYEHGDGLPFDGPGDTLAHAFFPNYGGDMHFDDSETWSTGRYGTNLLQVAVHELGHSLGLQHSSIQSSVMAPYYRYNDNFELDSDDISAVQELYGPPDYQGNNDDDETCSSEQFDCGLGGAGTYGRCVPNSPTFICDGVNDCANGADERNCEEDGECPVGRFDCGPNGAGTYGRCIVNSPVFICDGVNDCANGADERYCGLTLRLK